MASYSFYTDEQLIPLLKNDDQQAFTEIYNRHWPLVYRDAMKVLKSESDAEDAVQELFESIWKRRQTIEINASLPAYLRTSARYIALHIIEKNVSNYKSVESLEDFLNHSIIPVIESQIDASHLQGKINDIVNTLPGKMKEVFQLSRNEHLTHKEIAIRLNITEDTVKKQVYNALKLIRQGIDDVSVISVVLAVWSIS